MHILVFDSGLGGLTVFSEIRKVRGDARFTYLADDQVFPYGRLSEKALVERVLEVLGAAIERDRPDIVVIACNTASTLVLSHLREKHPIPFVGTVPAIKPAAEMTKSGMFSVMATPGTVARDYTKALVDAFAAGCSVNLVGCENLAALAEKKLRGEAVSDAELLVELELLYAEQGPKRTDVVVLACTHYPLLLDELKRLAPWPVTWIDSGRAIAKRVVQLIGKRPADVADAGPGRAIFTSGKAPGDALTRALAERGLSVG